MYCHFATRYYPSSADGHGKAVAVDLGPELLPAPWCVQQTAQRENHSGSLLLPFRSASAQPHLHYRLAGSLRHSRTDWQVFFPPLGIVHLVVMVAEVGDRLVPFFLHRFI